MGLIRIGGFPMDLALRETHSFPGEATKYPVEVGPDISDHIRELPDEIELECIVSDTPTGDVATDPTRTAADPTGEVPLPSAAALAKLRDLKALRKAVTVETSLGAFASMAFIDLQVPVEAGKSPGVIDQDPKKTRKGALFFTAKFQKVVIVSNKRTKVRVRTNVAGGAGRPKVVLKAAHGVSIIKSFTWMHGEPPGTPWRPPNEIEPVSIGYTKPAGVPRKQVAGLLDETLRYTELGYANGNVAFFDRNGEQIEGDRLDALRKDMLRDRKTTDSANPVATDTRFGPDGKMLPRARQNLPASVDITKWNIPANPGPVL